MIEGIYILLGLATALFILALAVKNSIVGLFSSLLFLLGGLSVITHGFGDLVTPYTTWIGIILIGLGAYVALQSGFDLIGVDS